MFIIFFNKAAIEQSETATKRSERIAALDDIIDTLIAAMAKAATTANMTEYRLDDGQTKISVAYKDPEAIGAAITTLERIKQMYVNRNNGRMVRLMPAQNFPNWRGGCF